MDYGELMIGDTTHHVKRIGTTFGVAAITCDRDSAKAEQVYVDIVDFPSHPVRVDAWVGYGIVGRMHLTKRQAKELAVLLIEAVTS